MRLNSIYLRDFRNYADTRASFVPGVNLLVGGNANGKTNLLEAIFYLSTGHAFRTRREQELIRFGAEFAELSAEVTAQEREQMLRAVLFSGRRPRQLWLNGVRQKTAAEFTGVVHCVLFCPEDLLVLKKGAAPRRKLLDTMICQLRPNYEAALTEYQRLLEQKSALLRDRFETPGLLEILPEYNERMAQVGALLISYRARFYDSLGKAAASYHNQFSGGAENFTLSYKTVSTVIDPFAPVPELTQNLLDHLQSHSRAELETAQCLTGPHKDDFTVSLSGIDLKAYGSQGQTRTAAISLKLAQRELMAREWGEEPVLLLDDVLSELDPGRQDFVLNKIVSGQVFITCCEPGRFTKLGKTIQIEKGSIRE